MSLQILRSPEEVREAIAKARSSGQLIGFVPTMGYLHEGHATLIRKAEEMAPIVVVSIFVNPLQFGPNEDFERYPRDLDHDLEVASRAGATHVFYPSVELLTPKDLQVMVEPGPMAEVLCGRSRPGHFRGVCTIVAKLFNIVQPDFAIFGWKDAQQLLIIRKMVQDLNFPVEIIGVETVREPDGLAMSSRNVYLSPDERQRAPILAQALTEAKLQALSGQKTAAKLRSHVIARVENEMGARVDYVEVVRMSDLSPMEEIELGNTMIAAAVFLGTTRLIDNVRL
ncbi:MAG: pantothenate synthetase [Candidatus Sumerlaea sp.]|uniref:Pantothenate synthetase n=1 Tax=Sumerlaea chitinivorans TaxID=2250252 RepID=A0A2Z4Y520_SUMC1|nr:Pantoate--beta-alanine ligase [Candidatus Sumerlaea chitinivorans]GIX44618.1 MAG: pantothenate synthetase [Candidatus Sumerlaea sp.]